MKTDIYTSGKKYSIIYADPPWEYRNKASEGAACNHYPTMSLEKLSGMSDQIDNITADDCILFLWATFPTIKDALALIDAWGFTYKTVAFVWIKENRKNGGLFMGLGNWTRSNAEVCLLATKGKPKRINACVHSVIVSPVGRHSEKPQEARDKIVKLCGDVPRIELFARQQSEGWDCWGNEV